MLTHVKASTKSMSDSITSDPSFDFTSAPLGQDSRIFTVRSRVNPTPFLRQVYMYLAASGALAALAAASGASMTYGAVLPLALGGIFAMLRGGGKGS